MPITNTEVALRLSALADLLEIEGENPFRIHAYRHAAQLIKHLEEPVVDRINTDKPLTDLPGIGKALDAKIREIVSTGHLNALEREEAHIPPTLRELLTIPGIGPRRIHIMYEQLNIRSRADLAATLDSGRLRSIRGFGQKLEESIREYLQDNPTSPVQATLLEPLLSSVLHGKAPKPVNCE